MKTVRTSNGDFLNDLGKKIYCYYWEPSEKPRGLVMLSHGFTEHCLLYSNLAQELAKKNFFVFAHDHMGHGRSEGTRGYLSKFNTIVEDILTHTDIVKKRFPTLPVFLCGHSMGGSSSILAAMKRPKDFSGLVLIAPALQSNPETATPIRVAIARMLNRIFPHFPLVYADFSLSCRDEAEVKKMNADPLRYHGYFKTRLTICLLDSAKEILERCSSIEFPFLLLHGDADKVCDIRGSRMMQENASSSDKTLKVYPQAYHSLLHEPYGVAEDVVQSTVQWLEERA